MIYPIDKNGRYYFDTWEHDYSHGDPYGEWLYKYKLQYNDFSQVAESIFSTFKLVLNSLKGLILPHLFNKLVFASYEVNGDIARRKGSKLVKSGYRLSVNDDILSIIEDNLDLVEKDNKLITFPERIYIGCSINIATSPKHSHQPQFYPTFDEENMKFYNHLPLKIWCFQCPPQPSLMYLNTKIKEEKPDCFIRIQTYCDIWFPESPFLNRIENNITNFELANIYGKQLAQALLAIERKLGVATIIDSDCTYNKFAKPTQDGFIKND